MEQLNTTNTNKIKILVVGGGAREHALAWKLSQSPRTERVYVAPGNAGMAGSSVLVPIEADNLEGLTKYAVGEKIGLVVIGPEGPLASGLADQMQAAGLTVFGPRAAAAHLESSKPFAKDFMARHHIPTAAYQNFTSPAAALEYLASKPEGPIVVKAAGLAQGKGVTVAQNLEEARQAVRESLEEKRFGEAGQEVVIEDFIDGEEVSILAFTDGQTIVSMPPVQDHKRLGVGDTGPNTGGMGAYSPVAIYTPELAAQVEASIIQPTLKALAAEGLPYQGCLYFGIIIPSAKSSYQGPQVIEYNCRFGDPETEVLMPLLKSDLVEIMLQCAQGNLGNFKVEWSSESVVCVVLASGGYPGAYPTGCPININSSAPDADSMAFYAGVTLNEKHQLVTAGGRVITLVAKGDTLEGALTKVYAQTKNFTFKDCYFRDDIAHRELARHQKV